MDRTDNTYGQPAFNFPENDETKKTETAKKPIAYQVKSDVRSRTADVSAKINQQPQIVGHTLKPTQKDNLVKNREVPKQPNTLKPHKPNLSDVQRTSKSDPASARQMHKVITQGKSNYENLLKFRDAKNDILSHVAGHKIDKNDQREIKNNLNDIKNSIKLLESYKDGAEIGKVKELEENINRLVETTKEGISSSKSEPMSKMEKFQRKFFDFGKNLLDLRSSYKKYDERLKNVQTPQIQSNKLEPGIVPPKVIQKPLPQIPSKNLEPGESVKSNAKPEALEQQRNQEIDLMLADLVKPEESGVAADTVVYKQESDVADMLNNIELTFNTASQISPDNSKAAPLSEWQKRDMETIEFICGTLGANSIQEYAESRNGDFIKLSRNEFKDLTHSYVLSPEGRLTPLFHNKVGELPYQKADGGETIFLGRGGFKTASRMGGGQVKQVVHRQGADLSAAIAATKVQAFKNCENLMVGHYITHTSAKTREVKQTFLVPEMKGGDIEHKYFPVENVINYYLQTANGLKVMHDNGWAHCDIKPANILLNDKNVKLADMDLAIEFKNANKINICGTPGYMSPDMSRGECKTDEDLKRNDMFGFGMSLLETMGYNVYEKFVNNPDNIKLSQDQKNDAFISYMKDFKPSLILTDLIQFLENQPSRSENYSEYMQMSNTASLAFEMLDDDPAKRPNIDQVISKLENLSKK